MREFFLRFGKVVDATVMVDRESGRSKGFGFVTFEDSNNSEEFVGKLGLMLDDKQVRMDVPLNHILPHKYRDRSKSKPLSPEASGIKRGTYIRATASPTSTIPTRAHPTQPQWVSRSKLTPRPLTCFISV